MEAIPVEVTTALGVFVPLVVGVLAKKSFSSKVKSYLAASISTALGLYLALISGQIDFSQFNADIIGNMKTVVVYIGAVAIFAQTAWGMYIKPSGLGDFVLENIGNKD